MPANWPVSALLVTSCGLTVCPMGTSTGYSTLRTVVQVHVLSAFARFLDIFNSTRHKQELWEVHSNNTLFRIQLRTNPSIMASPQTTATAASAFIKVCGQGAPIASVGLFLAVSVSALLLCQRFFDSIAHWPVAFSLVTAHANCAADHSNRFRRKYAATSL